MSDPAQTAPPPLLLCRLQDGERNAVERFYLQEMDDVALFWRFFRTMTPDTVKYYVARIPFTGGGAVFGAFLGPRLVGVAEFAAMPGSARCGIDNPRQPGGVPACAEIGIAVSGRQRRRGIARSLLERLMNHAWTRGIARLQVSSLAGNHPMIRLAESLGFRKVIEHNDEVIMHALRPADFVPDAAPQAVGDFAENAGGSPARATRRIVCPVLLYDRRCP